MTVTLDDLRTATARRLGDASHAIWTGAEIDDYIREGQEDLCLKTGCLMAHLLAPDVPAKFNFTSKFELDYIATEDYVNGPYQFTYEFERDFLDNLNGPANHNEYWEYDFVTTTEVSALVDLPEDLYEIERATWNTIRIDALRSRFFEADDSRYELAKGEVEAYTQDKDGLRRLRKWRVPSAPYTPTTFDVDVDIYAFTFNQSWEEDYLPSGAESNGPLAFTSGYDQRFASSSEIGHGTHNYLWELLYSGDELPSDGFGILRDIGDIVPGLTVIVTPTDGYGDLVQVDTVETFNDFGILGPIHSDGHTLRAEYSRRPASPSDHQDFEIQDRYTIYIRHYAMARAFEREGDGQDFKLAAHYQSRYDAGLQRMARRREAVQFQRKHVLGGMASRLNRGPRLRLPWNYGSTVRR